MSATAGRDEVPRLEPFARGRLGGVLTVLANAIPLFGVLLWGWDVGFLMALFWAENLVLGGINVGRMLAADPANVFYWAFKLFLIPFFCVHFGMFTAGHGLFVMQLFTGGGGPDDLEMPWDLLSSFVALYPALPAALAGIALVHLVHTWADFISTGAYRRVNPMALMFQPYSRIVVLHVTLIFGGFAVEALGEPLAALVVLLALKTAIDLGLWVFGGTPGAKDSALAKRLQV
ncbi:MAG: hypothetical protein CL625_01715 [Arenimonas sp.]|nr:hypothetical protein [Arenimonas sp.]